MTLTYTVTGKPNPKAVALLLESVYRFLAEREAEIETALTDTVCNEIYVNVTQASEKDFDNNR